MCETDYDYIAYDFGCSRLPLMFNLRSQKGEDNVIRTCWHVGSYVIMLLRPNKYLPQTIICSCKVLAANICVCEVFGFDITFRVRVGVRCQGAWSSVWVSWGPTTI